MKRALILLPMALFSILCSPASVHATPQSASLASFEGRWIDLSKGWQDAKACNVGPDGTVCFRTEAEMAAALTGASASSMVGTAAAPTCSTGLRLYAGSNFTGSVLTLTARQTYLTLANYGFDNVTSSYRVGACAVDLYSGASGAGSLYPGPSYAWAQVPIMLSAWNNVLSSVYIY